MGDVKQSIYRFRLADPTIFLDKYRRFKPWDQAAEGEERTVVLTRNFRSRPEVLEGTNDLFRNIMSTEFGELDYTQEMCIRDSPRGYGFPMAEEDQALLERVDRARRQVAAPLERLRKNSARTGRGQAMALYGFLEAVSYTHLDVYKRQGLEWIEYKSIFLSLYFYIPSGFRTSQE